MKAKEELVKNAVEDCECWIEKTVKHSLTRMAETLTRRAWNAGYETALEYHKDEIEVHEKTAFEEGYKKCLSENDFESPCTECEDRTKAATAEADKTISYEKGMEDAWKAAGMMCCWFHKDDMLKVFGTEDLRTLFINFSPSGAKKLIDDYIKKQDYEIGDEVIAEDGKACFVITSIGNDIAGIDKYGCTYSYMPHEISGKTGNRYKLQMERIDG